MADFDEVLAQIREHKGEEPLPATMYETLAQEHQALRDQLDGATSQLAEKETGITQAQAEVSRLKSANYDLVIAQQGKPAETKTLDPERPSGIKGLFNTRKK